MGWPYGVPTLTFTKSASLTHAPCRLRRPPAVTFRGNSQRGRESRRHSHLGASYGRSLTGN